MTHTRLLPRPLARAGDRGPAVARVIARELGRGEAWEREQVAAFERRARESVLDANGRPGGKP